MLTEAVWKHYSVDSRSSLLLMKLLLIKHCLWSVAYLTDAYKLGSSSIAAIFKTWLQRGAAQNYSVDSRPSPLLMKLLIMKLLLIKLVLIKLLLINFCCFPFQRSLTLDCKEGQPGIIQWTPDRDTPDLVYYQCYTHRYLGWKIHVVDSCDQ